jgi:RNA polymerase sigma-70 factor (ECF subfamily)
MEGRTSQDRDLVAAALQGDAAAFRGLVERYQNLVAGLAWRYGLRREEIEDVVSEVFLKVYRNLDSYRPEHPFSTWLYRVAMNHLLDQGRRRAREGTRVDLPRDLEATGERADRRLELRERARLLREALRQLEPKYREAIFLVYVEELRVEDAARLLGVPEGTVKTRLMRARQALRRLLAARYPDHFGHFP